MFRRALAGHLRRLLRATEYNQGNWGLRGNIESTFGLVRLSTTTLSQAEVFMANAILLVRQHTHIYEREILSLIFHRVYYWLGRCFMAVGDGYNAQIMFQQEFALLGDSSDDGLNVSSSFQCDRCARSIDRNMGLRICQCCRETDLCDSCFDQCVSLEVV